MLQTRQREYWKGIVDCAEGAGPSPAETSRELTCAPRSPAQDLRFFGRFAEARFCSWNIVAVALNYVRSKA